MEILKADNDVSKEQRLDGKHLLEEFLDAEARRRVLEDGIRVDGRKIYLGRYDTAADAHAAYCSRVKEFHGEFARTS